jgi:hypothetical protein
VVADALDLRQRSPDPRHAAIGRLLAGDTGRPATATGGAPDLRYRIVEEVLDLLEASRAARPVVVVHGISLEEGFPPPEQILNLDAADV